MSDRYPLHPSCPIGTEITATKTATATSETVIRFLWQIEKSAAEAPQTPIPPGECIDLAYRIAVTRTEERPTVEATTTGIVCITNTGTVPTQGLTILDELQVNFGFGFSTFESKVITPEQLAPGETRCIPITFTFALPPAGSFRNRATVTITNFIGHEGTPFGVTVIAPFRPPEPTTTTTIDATATVTDFETCPAGFTCESSHPGPFPVSGTTALEFTKRVCNVSACGPAVVQNQATLFTTDTETVIFSNEVLVQISGPPCPVTRGIGRLSTPL